MAGNILEDTQVNSGAVNVQPIFPSFTNILTTTTAAALVKTGAGFLHAVIVNKTAAGAVIVVDGTTGGGTMIGTLKASIVEGSYIYDVKFTTGLYVRPAGVGDYTIVYR